MSKQPGVTVGTPPPPPLAVVNEVNKSKPQIEHGRCTSTKLINKIRTRFFICTRQITIGTKYRGNGKLIDHKN
jgi:hypothetical protein